MKVKLNKELPVSNSVSIDDMVEGVVYRFREYLITRDDNDGVIVIDTDTGRVRVYSNYYALCDYIDGCTTVEQTNLVFTLSVDTL